MTDAPDDLVYRNEAVKILSEGQTKEVSERQVRRYEDYGLLVPVDNEMHGKQRRPRYRRADVLAIKELRARSKRVDNA
jgi:DNA-binding transcriptional MerR regulator